MILVEEHIQQIMLFRLFPQKDNIIEYIMELSIENHFADKSTI